MLYYCIHIADQRRAGSVRFRHSARFPIGQACVLRTRMENLRCTAGLAHSLVGLCPRWKVGIRLCPMGNRSFIAPVQEARHQPPYESPWSCRHAYSLRYPRRSWSRRSSCGPAAAHRLEIQRIFGLGLSERESMKSKARQETDRSDSQARQANESHRPLTRKRRLPLGWDQEFERRRRRRLCPDDRDPRVS